MRGENGTVFTIVHGHLGTSPRARGKLLPGWRGVLAEWNIPACAGKTPTFWERGAYGWEHPRVRGENHHQQQQPHQAAGTSPRARGKPLLNAPS